MPIPQQPIVAPVPNNRLTVPTPVTSHPMVKSGQETGHTTLPQTLTNAVSTIRPNLSPANINNFQTGTPQNVRPVVQDAFAAANRARPIMLVQSTPIINNSRQTMPVQNVATTVNNGRQTTPTTNANYNNKVFGASERKIVL